MSEHERRIEELAAKLNAVQKQQYTFDNEIHSLRNELDNLKNILRNQLQATSAETSEVVEEKTKLSPKAEPEFKPKILVREVSKIQKPRVLSHALEDFIGTNLISKIGILITIIGVFIGAKYAIDKDLISPAMRILTGYLAGAALIFTALKLKTKYENFSAVLMGGGLAVVYFITYTAYSFYQLFPQSVSFLLMIGITVCTAFCALWYDRKIIAVLGQVGAYAIPFLLSDGSGKILILFTYISIINAGLLILSFKKDWKILYRLAFVITWLIYASWLIFKERTGVQAEVGFIFLCINFLTFYVTFLSYKVIKKELYNVEEVGLMLINALAFFFSGMFLVEDVFTDAHVLTYFTLANALIHFGIGLSIHRFKLADTSVYQFIIGLGFLFVTIAIPVELDGSWVTLLWAIEASILSWIAFKDDRRLYLVITLPMVAIACMSLLQDWYMAYPHINRDAFASSKHVRPFLNITFSFSLIVSACFGFISYVAYKNKAGIKSSLVSFFQTALPVLFAVILYAALYNEIYFSWNSYVPALAAERNNETYFRELSLLMYSFIYVALWLEFIRQYSKRKTGLLLLYSAAIVCLLFFLGNGLTAIGLLRDNYLSAKKQHLSPSPWLLGIRYFCFLSFAFLIIICRKALRLFADTIFAGRIFSSLFNIVLLSVICNEFIHWMDIAGYQDQYKLGLSIICALYALALIFTGISKKKMHLRIGAIILFSITLLKLFFYDLATLSTISKTIVLVVLGVILLVISFLYNKHKSIIIGEDIPVADSDKANK